MTLRLTAPQAAAMGLATTTKPLKYRNKIVVVDGITFRSQKEANYSGRLELEKKAGAVLWYTRQVPFYLPGGVKWLADFVVVRPLPLRAHAPVAWAGVIVEVVDVKGYFTAMYRLKKRQVEALYGFTILEV